MVSVNRRIFKDTVTVTILGIIGQAFGYGVTLFIAVTFGATWITDAYYLAIIIPITLTGIIAGVAKVVIVPIFVEERIKNPEEASDIIASTLGVTLLFSVLSIITILVLSSENIIEFGTNSDIVKLTQTLLLELLPLIPLVLCVTVLNAVYNSYQKFGLAETAKIVKNLTVLMSIIMLSKSIGIHSLVVGNIFGQFLNLIITGWAVYSKSNLDFKLRFKLNPGIIRIFKLSVIPFIAIIILQFNPLFSRIISALLPEGSVTILSYAERLVTIPSLVIGTGFVSVILSHWAKLTAENNESQLSDSLNRFISMFITVLSPIIIGLFLLREPLIRLILHHGALSEEAVLSVSEVFSVLIIGIMPNYLHMIISRILIVKKKLVLLSLLSVLSVIIHPLLSYTLAIIFNQGLMGIASSSIITSIIISSLTAYQVHKYHIRISFSQLYQNLVKVGIASFFMTVVLFVFKNVLKIQLVEVNLLIQIIGFTLIGSSIYIFSLYILRHKDLKTIMRIINSHFKKELLED